MAGDERPRVRVRGIYATALTKVLESTDGVSVVDASRAIDRRFDAAFDGGDADATIRMSEDREGIEISGSGEAVGHVEEIVRDVGQDTFSWTAVAPKGAIFEGEVVRTNRGGGIVSLGGGREGFLPFGATDDYLGEGDTVRVQVHEPRPPWAEGEPKLGTEIRAAGEIATLVRGVDALVAGTPDGTAEHELARTTEMLSTTVPEAWGVRWEYAAEDADMSVLDSALRAAVEQAEMIEAALESSSDQNPLVTPLATTWVWFGRESRFALDEHRDAVTPTMTGHHRIKAGSSTAGTAVDFAEQLDAVDGEFPFGPVTAVFGPVVGEEVAIRHGKPDGRCLTLGTGTVTDRTIEKQRITVEREISSRGTYDALGTDREPGDIATTRFTEGRWWYPTVYRSEDGQTKGTYVNIATPVEIFPRSVRYMDLHIDVIKRPDGTVDVVDQDELVAAVEEGQVPEAVAEKARSVATKVASAFDS